MKATVFPHSVTSTRAGLLFFLSSVLHFIVSFVFSRRFLAVGKAEEEEGSSGDNVSESGRRRRATMPPSLSCEEIKDKAAC